MPVYDFRCSKCNKKFTVTMSISEYGSRKVKCPKCGNSRVEQLITHFQTITSKKS